MEAGGVERRRGLGDLPDELLARIFGATDLMSDGRALDAVSRRVRRVARGALWHPDPLRPLVVSGERREALEIVHVFRSGRARAVGAISIDASGDGPYAADVLWTMGRAGVRLASIHAIGADLDGLLELLGEEESDATGEVERLVLELPDERGFPDADRAAEIARRFPGLREIAVLVGADTAGLSGYRDLVSPAVALGDGRRCRIVSLLLGSRPRVLECSVGATLALPGAIAARLDEVWFEAENGLDARDLASEVAREGPFAEVESETSVLVVWEDPRATPPRERVEALARWAAENATPGRALGAKLGTESLPPDAAARIALAMGASLRHYARVGAAFPPLGGAGAAAEVAALAEIARLGRLDYIALMYRTTAAELRGQLPRLRDLERVVERNGRARVELAFRVPSADAGAVEGIEREVVAFFGGHPRIEVLADADP